MSDDKHSKSRLLSTGEYAAHMAKMQSYYEQTAHMYEVWHCHSGLESSHDYAVREIERLVVDTNSASVLDVGCGTGRALKAMLAKNINAYGVDCSSKLLGIAQTKHGIPGERCILGDAASLPFKDSEIDLVCALGVLHHSADPQRLVNEMLRVARKGIVLSDNGNHPVGGLRLMLQRLGLLKPLCRLFLKREPRQTRKEMMSEGDGPTYVFSLDEVLPIIPQKFPRIRKLAFYGTHSFEFGSYWLPSLFARHVIAVCKS